MPLSGSVEQFSRCQTVARDDIWDSLHTRSQVLVHQLSSRANDIQGALVIRWLSYILFLDFTIRHVKGVKNTMTDRLSRKPVGSSDQVDREA